MDYLHTNLGPRAQGEVVEVTLSTAANVRLMDDKNFNSYTSGQTYEFLGGLVETSLFTVQLPHSDDWHVVIDMDGIGGSVRASVRIRET